MAEKKGMKRERWDEGVITLSPSPGIVSWFSVVGQKEREGPLGSKFDRVMEFAPSPEKSFEVEERELVMAAFSGCCDGVSRPNVAFGGDLLNQCVSTGFAMREQGIPYVGLYGACSTMAESLALASIFVWSGASPSALAVTSSHYCTAERQYRLPLNYGGQRPPTAQWTVTGSGAVLLQSDVKKVPLVKRVAFGRVLDYGVSDPFNMGAAMAPAAADTLLRFFEETNTKPADYDRIFTGDLGYEGADLLCRLMEKEGMALGKEYEDCGRIIFDPETQDTHAGGSGCGCSAVVLCGEILPRIRAREWEKVLFLATGALMSPTTLMQKESIPAIAHLVEIHAPEE